jgi:hypothetical protein
MSCSSSGRQRIQHHSGCIHRGSQLGFVSIGKSSDEMLYKRTADILAGSKFRVARGLILGKKAGLVVGDTVLSNGKGGQREKGGSISHICGCGVVTRGWRLMQEKDAREENTGIPKSSNMETSRR